MEEFDKKASAEKNRKVRQDKRMAASQEEVDEEQLIKFYGIALEAAWHSSQLFTAIWTRGIVTIGVLIAALNLARQFSPAPGSLQVWSVIGLGGAVLIWLYLSFSRHASDAYKWRDFARNIKDNLTGKTLEQRINLISLLIAEKDKKMRAPWDKGVWSIMWDPPGRRLLQLLFFLLCWIGICWLLLGGFG